ncbi:auxin-responsive protein SAUR21-like [Cornus florida]|uniref:auxin-responsive protein SAUR21-like n=1 Tax=Cornus florida TaxID=4283 RepID=UPI0028A11308|nr:auxin-responsive protein SAUR21-like [Cornus florida]
MLPHNLRSISYTTNSNPVESVLKQCHTGVLQAKQILRQSLLTAGSAASNAVNVPKGYLAVYVEESQKTRFLVPLSYLNQPEFQELLHKAEEEYGFDHPMGGLTIPCPEDTFLDITSHLSIL